MRSSTNTNKIQNLWTKLRNKVYRQQFADSQLATTIAAQIASMREAKGWTQARLGGEVDMKQSRISTLEDGSYDKMSITTLKRIAGAFDVALVVRFVPFSELLGWRTNVSPRQLAPPSFEADSLFDTINAEVWLSPSRDDEPVVSFHLPANENRSFLGLDWQGVEHRVH